ncbi:MAG TPA: M56 family metallopeptidase [Acidobacteriaceae bacterium]|nr:M56 family metallopeptidase [Acidobacteriaceae bacterium]
MATYAVNALWQVPLLAGAGWAASRLLGRVGPRAQHRVWVATLLLSIAMPALPLVQTMVGWPGSASGGTVRLSLAAVTGGADITAHGGALLVAGWLLWSICALYVGTVLYFAGRLAWLMMQTRVLVGESVPAELPDTLQAAWARCRRAFGANATGLRTSGTLRGVVTAGARWPVIVVPDGFVESCTEQEFLSAVAHECAHIRRRDSVKNFLYEAASVMTAFHPVTWMVKAQVSATREIVCDARVVETLVDTRTYTQSLLRLAERMLTAGADPIHAIGMFDANVLEKRIMWMKARKRSVGRAAQWALAVGGALVLGSVAAAGASMGTGVAAANHDATDTGKVYRPGEGGVTNPVLTYAPDPEFPKGDKSQGGVCVLGLVVDAHGMPRDVHVVRSLKADFDANALAVVRQYRFKPGTLHEKSVAVRIHIEVNYRRY